MSVQDHFTLSESEISDVAESQAEDHTAEESPDPMYHNSEESHGYEDFSLTFKIILQHNIKLQQNTALTQKKYQN